jgi:hypothetical protein
MKKDIVGDVYAFLLLGVVVIAFVGGYLAGSQKVDKTK